MPRPATTAVQIVHFNDVYNIDVAPREPVGGAARFVTAIRRAVANYEGPSIVVFSGDAFSPAPLTTFTEGAEIPTVLNAAGVDVACIGNHEFDRGLDVMKQRIAETNFPWLVSNVTEIRTALPVGGIKDFYVIERAELRFGFMGLAACDWLETLSTVKIDDLNYVDYVEAADRYAAFLRDEHKCDYIIALTHMRQPDDDRLAREAKDVDLILGGHDHVLSKKFINGRYVLKSGTDFKNYSTIELDVDTNWSLYASEPIYHNVTSDIPEDPVIAAFVKEKLSLLGNSRWEILAVSECDLDGRFIAIRSKETGLGNFIADLMKSYMGATIGLINSGSFRSDAIEPPGSITQQTIDTILPFHDEAVLVEISGRELLAILENSVSEYPNLDGRFLQVSGLKFSFDPREDPYKRIDRGSVMCMNELGEMSPLDEQMLYRCAVKTYIFAGKDGYPMGKDEQILARSDTTIPKMVVRHFNEDGSENRASPPEINPQNEERITCLWPDEELVEWY